MTDYYVNVIITLKVKIVIFTTVQRVVDVCDEILRQS